MKVKTITAALNAKFAEFVKTIDDPKTRDLVLDNTLITGGCIASMLLREDVNDYDMYFRNKETALAVAIYYCKKFAEGKKKKKTEDEEDAFASFGKADTDPAPAPEPTSTDFGIVHFSTTIENNGISTPVYVVEDEDRIRIYVQSSGVVSDNEGTYNFFEGDPNGNEAGEYVKSCFEGNEFHTRKPGTYAPVLVTDNAITLTDDIQLVLRFYGDPKEIHEFYDFVHCTNFWTSWDMKVVVNPAALESLLTRELRYIGSQYPIASIIRIRKFIQRGWTINAGQIFKMCVQTAAMITPQDPGKNWYQPGSNNLMLENIPLLQDQLVGVDQAYFMEILSKLRDPEREKDKPLDQTYLFTLIDEIF